MTTETDLPLFSPDVRPGNAPRVVMPDESICYAIGQSRLCVVLVATTANGICAILLGDDRTHLTDELRDAFPAAQLVASDAQLTPMMVEVVRFLEEPKRGLDRPLDLRGTPFQKQVWEALRQVPAGSTVTYSAIAERIGAPKEAYAVGEACAANTLAVAVPCHRVVRKDGTLAGYRWGF